MQSLCSQDYTGNQQASLLTILLSIPRTYGSGWVGFETAVCTSLHAVESHYNQPDIQFKPIQENHTVHK